MRAQRLAAPRLTSSGPPFVCLPSTLSAACAFSACAHQRLFTLRSVHETPAIRGRALTMPVNHGASGAAHSAPAIPHVRLNNGTRTQRRENDHGPKFQTVELANCFRGSLLFAMPELRNAIDCRRLRSLSGPFRWRSLGTTLEARLSARPLERSTIAKLKFQN
jgi:hypothetical protein